MNCCASSFLIRIPSLPISSSTRTVLCQTDTVLSKINVENRWRGVFSLSTGRTETSHKVRSMGIIETHRAHLVRASDSNEWLRKNFKTAGISGSGTRIWNTDITSTLQNVQPPPVPQTATLTKKNAPKSFQRLIGRWRVSNSVSI